MQTAQRQSATLSASGPAAAPPTHGAVVAGDAQAVALRGAAVEDAVRPGRFGGLRRRLRDAMAAVRGRAPFLIIVVLPTALAGIYFAAIAADRYVAEARFVVRGAERGPASGIGALLQTTGIAAAPDDAFIVRAYIESRDALAELDERVDFADMMGSDVADPLARWPNLLEGDSFEALYDYYSRRVLVTQDLASGVSTLKVQAFAPADARLIAATLLEQSEAFVNRMNARARTDTLDLAREEVALAEERVRLNQGAFSEFRRREGLVSPVADSEAQMDLVARLSGERARLEAETRRLAANAAASPQLPALRARIAALDGQIAAERATLVGRSDALSDSYGEFESLLLEQEFASEALMTARAALEQARADAQRKQRYLETVVDPRVPDKAREPRRLMMALSVAATAFLLYAVGWLLWVNAREHVS